jgi:hypothetical protein
MGWRRINSRTRSSSPGIDHCRRSVRRTAKWTPQLVRCALAARLSATIDVQCLFRGLTFDAASTCPTLLLTEKRGMHMTRFFAHAISFPLRVSINGA